MPDSASSSKRSKVDYIRAAAQAWLPPNRRHGTGEVLVCFPPAGAAASFFREWHNSLPQHRIVPVQLPGREERLTEPAIETVAEIARCAADSIKTQDWPSIHLLGYSYGALLAFETAHCLERDGGPTVTLVVACARAAPQTNPQPTVADCNDVDLIGYVKSLGGLPPEVETEPVLLDLILPALRADFRANDLYASPTDRKIQAPIVTIAGTVDPATSDGRDAAWGARTRGDHTLASIDGGHFFVLDNPSDTFDAIHRALTPQGQTQNAETAPLTGETG